MILSFLCSGGRAMGGLALLATICLLLMPEPAFAEFQKATAGAKQVQRWLWIVIPVVALIAAAVIGLLYSNDIVRKETLYQWAGGIAFVGAIAGGIIDLFF